MAQLSRRIRQSLSPQPPLHRSASSDEGSSSANEMTTTTVTTVPLPLQAGPRKLKKGENVKNRMSMAFRKFSKPPAQAQTSLSAPRQTLSSSTSSSPTSLPSYAAASSSPSRGYFGPAPEVITRRQEGSISRESGRSNKPQPLSTEGIVPRRSHVGAGAVGTSPPLPPIPPSMSVTYEGGGGNAQTTFKASATSHLQPCDGLGIALDLDSSSPLSTPRITRSTPPPEFPILANISHVEPLRLSEYSRDRLVRTRASISVAPSDMNSVATKTRGANRLAGETKCYTVATFSNDSIVPLSRPPKSALRTAAVPSSSRIATATAWTNRSEPLIEPSTISSSSSSSTPPPSAGHYCLRPTVHVSTQTPPEWNTSSYRRFSTKNASTPPQAFSSFTDVFAPPPSSRCDSFVPPSPSVYSIASVETSHRRPSGAGHRKGGGESVSSMHAFTQVPEAREEDLEDLKDVIDRHLGELESLEKETVPSIEVREGGFDVPFLDPSPYDTPHLRPFEIPSTPLALPPPNSQHLVPSPALTSATSNFDRTPTLPSSSLTRPISPTSSSSSARDSDSSEEGSSTPPTSASSSTFEEASIIQLAEQEPIQIRKASLLSTTTASSRKSSLIPIDDSLRRRRQSAHSRNSSISTKSVKFNLVDSTTAQESSPSNDKRDFAEPLHSAVPLPGRRRSESDKLPLPQPRPQGTMSREERAMRGRSYFLVQALMGHDVTGEGAGMIRDWARDSDEESSESEEEWEDEV
ncbi:uncharacterized protein JCM6883_003713 [Sporobolomyces salmoneus]|uniref:uncharacterized protein n=1 Tax=Sporobolomyces salmoneus TaxID=183962 RepID=UPI00317E6AD7